jgi:hypothetical protein
MPVSADDSRSKSAQAFCELLMRIRAVHRQGIPLHGTELRVGRSIQMFDLIMLAIGLSFFALSIGYVYACDRL